MDDMDFSVTFYGVRGSRPVPGLHTLQYGGNTPCILVRAGGRLIILDAGTGIVPLGQQLLRQGRPASGDIFISHTHWDHIQGFPFFAPAFNKDSRFVLYGEPKVDRDFSQLMRGQMMSPHFPIPLDHMGAQISFREIQAGQTIVLSERVTVRTSRSNHPNGCTVYRIDCGGKSICYLSDTEHSAEVDPQLVELARGSDIVIYDANYTDEEYQGRGGQPSRRGWGHSTWREGIRLVRAAGARQLILFHHSADRTDAEQAVIEVQAQREYPDCLAAREGMVLPL